MESWRLTYVWGDESMKTDVPDLRAKKKYRLSVNFEETLVQDLNSSRFYTSTFLLMAIHPVLKSTLFATRYGNMVSM
jgi:hypothetical protein